MNLYWKIHSKHSQTAAKRIDVITSLSIKLPWSRDSEGTFLSLTQAATCRPHTVEASHCPIFSAARQAKTCE